MIIVFEEKGIQCFKTTMKNEKEVIQIDPNILKFLFDQDFYQIDVYGASGNEQDHFLGNLHTAIQWKNKLKLTFLDNYGSYFLADKSTIITDCKNKVVSLVPFPSVEKITTEGLQYQLNNEDLVFGKRIGTRNKAKENKIKITFESGNLFLFINEQNNE